jgi:hypothetical protein
LSHFQQLSLVFWPVPLSTASPKILKKCFFLFKEKKQFEGKKHLNFGMMNIAKTFRQQKLNFAGVA